MNRSTAGLDCPLRCRVHRRVAPLGSSTVAISPFAYACTKARARPSLWWSSWSNDLPFTRGQVPEGSSVGKTTKKLCRRPAGTIRGLSARRGASACPSACDGLLGGFELTLGLPAATQLSFTELHSQFATGVGDEKLTGVEPVLCDVAVENGAPLLKTAHKRSGTAGCTACRPSTNRQRRSSSERTARLALRCRSTVLCPPNA